MCYSSVFFVESIEQFAGALAPDVAGYKNFYRDQLKNTLKKK